MIFENTCDISRVNGDILKGLKLGSSGPVLTLGYQCISSRFVDFFLCCNYSCSAGLPFRLKMFVTSFPSQTLLCIETYQTTKGSSCKEIVLFLSFIFSCFFKFHIALHVCHNCFLTACVYPGVIICLCKACLCLFNCYMVAD